MYSHDLTVGPLLFIQLNIKKVDSKRVSVGSFELVEKKILSGVRQVSVLGPLLFNLYIHPLCIIMKNRNTFLRFNADDAQMFISLPCDGLSCINTSYIVLTYRWKTFYSSKLVQRVRERKSDNEKVAQNPSKAPDAQLPLNWIQCLVCLLLCSLTTGVPIMIVGIKASLQHLGYFVHLIMLNEVHEFPQIGLHMSQRRRSYYSENEE